MVREWRRVVDWDGLRAEITAACRRLGLEGDPPACWRQLARRMGRGDTYLYDLWSAKKVPDPERLMALADISGVDLLVWYRHAGLLPEDLVGRRGSVVVSAEVEALLRDAVREWGVEGLREVIEWHRRWRADGSGRRQPTGEQPVDPVGDGSAP